ncbi:MAG: hypothetical protein M0Z78_08970 [Betaproteobacteria bacterium]|nr:hypothetical protein [Betaproteobacteria bacterium]
MKLKQTILCTSLIASLLFISSSKSFARSTSNGETLWSGMVSAQSLDRDSKNFLRSMNWESIRSTYAKIENVEFAASLARSRQESVLMPLQADMMKYIAVNTQLYFDHLFKEAKRGLVDIALRSPNRGPIALSKTESETLSSSLTGGGTAIVGSASSSQTFSESTTTTTCEENLAWKGYKVSCKTGEGAAVVDGITVSFKRWEPIKAEGTVGTINWRYQSGTLQFEDVTGNTVWFLVGRDNLSVVKSKLLTSFKRDQIAMVTDSSTSDVTAEYTDLMWRESLMDGSLTIGSLGSGEWHPLFAASDVGIQSMISFVYRLTRFTQSQLDEKLDQVDKLSGEEISNLKKCHLPFDYSRKSIVENGLIVPYVPNAIFNVKKPARGNGGNW